jgi:hypothetical protein
MKTIKRSSLTPRKRSPQTATKVAIVRESRVILYGRASDAELRASQKKIEVSGRKTEIQARPGYDTGAGQCGKHLCHCNGHCQLDYIKGTQVNSEAA